MDSVWNNLRMFLWLTFITGIVYPFIMTGIAQLAVPSKAGGDLITINGKIVGSRLIGQKFESSKYVWGRPSAVDYNPLPSGGSNLGPTSAALKKAVADRQAVILKEHNLSDKNLIPSDLLFASGSGLDPHIKPDTARFQMKRIIKARGWDEEKALAEVSKLIDANTERGLFGVLGRPRVNVLMLNLALDELGAASPDLKGKKS